jgi:hypothetical protein
MRIKKFTLGDIIIGTTGILLLIPFCVIIALLVLGYMIKNRIFEGYWWNP